VGAADRAKLAGISRWLALKLRRIYLPPVRRKQRWAGGFSLRCEAPAPDRLVVKASAPGVSPKRERLGPMVQSPAYAGDFHQQAVSRHSSPT
jgi:hypothetical protein